MSAINDSNEECADMIKTFTKIRGLDIGEEMQQRIQTGQVSEERAMNYDKEWIRKLQCYDDTHTKQNKITFKDADRLLRKLWKFAEGGTPPGCPDQQKRVLSCLKQNKNHAMRCNEEIEAFTNCVDDMLLKTSRKDCKVELGCKKLSYAEKFEQVRN